MPRAAKLQGGDGQARVKRMTSLPVVVLMSISVTLMPGYDWQVLLDELARLETAAFGDTVYGERRAERIV